MTKSLLVFVLLCTVVLAIVNCGSITLANFNIQVFGVKKMENAEVVDVLVKTLRNFELISMQEIRDSTDTAIYQLMEKLNEDNKHTYRVVTSDRLGRSVSKEQYGFIYDTSRVKILDSFHYPDSADKFERPPFSAVVVPANGKAGLDHAFFITNIHTSPSDAVSEIGALTDVQAYFSGNGVNHEESQGQQAPAKISRNEQAEVPKPLINAEFNPENADYKTLAAKRWIVLGDYNADCSYFPMSRRNGTELYKDRKNYSWLIPDGFDTTVSQHGCAYDRIVVSKQLVDQGSIARVGAVFNFREEFGLSLEEAKKVSDHFPVFVTIRIFD